jgi:hypothetical protein
MRKQSFNFEKYRTEKLQNKVIKININLSVPDAFKVLVGEIYNLDNTLFNIGKEKSKRHPGVTIELRDLYARVSVGTDEKNIIKPYYLKFYTKILPDDGNGLRKPTLFKADLHEVAFQKFNPERLRGRLSADDFQTIYSAIKYFSKKAT